MQGKFRIVYGATRAFVYGNKRRSSMRNGKVGAVRRERGAIPAARRQGGRIAKLGKCVSAALVYGDKGGGVSMRNGKIGSVRRERGFVPAARRQGGRICKLGECISAALVYSDKGGGVVRNGKI